MAEHPYDPWRDLAEHWPEIDIVVEAMPAGLLGELRYPVIALRAGTSSAQRRCTLAHELVHLERGVRDCGPWEAREELHVHREVAGRLVSASALAQAVRMLGGGDDEAALAHALDIDTETLRTRLSMLSAEELADVRAASVQSVWGAA